MSPAGLSTLSMFVVNNILLAGPRFHLYVDVCSATTVRYRTAPQPGEEPRSLHARGHGNSRTSQPGYGGWGGYWPVLSYTQNSTGSWLTRRAGWYPATMRPGETFERGGGSQGGLYSPGLL